MVSRFTLDSPQLRDPQRRRGESMKMTLRADLLSTYLLRKKALFSSESRILYGVARYLPTLYLSVDMTSFTSADTGFVGVGTYLR